MDEELSVLKLGDKIKRLEAALGRKSRDLNSERMARLIESQEWANKLSNAQTEIESLQSRLKARAEYLAFIKGFETKRLEGENHHRDVCSSLITLRNFMGIIQRGARA